EPDGDVPPTERLTWHSRTSAPARALPTAAPSLDAPGVTAVAAPTTAQDPEITNDRPRLPSTLRAPASRPTASTSLTAAATPRNGRTVLRSAPPRTVTGRAHPASTPPRSARPVTT